MMCSGLVNGLEPQAKQYAKELIPVLCVTAIRTLNWSDHTSRSCRIITNRVYHADPKKIWVPGNVFKFV